MLDSSADPPATIRSRPVLPHWEMLLDASRMMLPREPFKGRERSFLPSGTKRQKDRGGEGRGGGGGGGPPPPPPPPPLVLGGGGQPHPSSQAPRTPVGGRC